MYASEVEVCIPQWLPGALRVSLSSFITTRGSTRRRPTFRDEKTRRDGPTDADWLLWAIAVARKNTHEECADELFSSGLSSLSSYGL